MKRIKTLIRIFALLLVLLGASSSAFGAYYMKHPWGGNGWEWKQLDGNNQITAAYGGNGVNVHTSADDNGAQWIQTPNLVGNPTTGTQCVFKYDPASKTVTITATGTPTPTPSASGMYVIGDAIEGWNDANDNPIFKAMKAGTNGEFYYEGVASERQFKFTTQNNWSDASQSLYNQSSADNTKSVGSTINKVGNDNNLQVTLEQGYADPITFYVNSSTKKFWSIATKKVNFDLTASKTDYDTANAPTELTLKVETDNTTTGDFIWYQSADGENYTEIAGVTGDTYTLTGDDVPMFDTYFKVKRAKADNTTPALEYLEDTVKISVFQTCGEGTKGSNLFKITFDDDTKLKTLLGAGSRMEFDAMVDGYVYAKAPQKIDDGEYAIVTEPLYCGYGTGGQEECGTDLGCIDEKIKNNPNDRWFRGFRDHTQNKGGANPPFGGMLLINFADIDAGDDESGIAFSRELTAEDTKDFTKGATLTFSAYMASAAVKEKPNVTFLPINAELKIEFKATGATKWEEVASLESQVEFDDNWKRFETSLKLTSTDGEFRVVIKNNGSTGSGNDLLIDDISLDLCSPTISLEFVDIEGVEHTFTSVDEEISLSVPKVNFGSIDEPCMMLFGLDADGKYTYIADMIEAEESYVATNAVNGGMLVEIGDDGSRNIKPMQLQAVVSEQLNGACNERIKLGVEDGTYTPGKDPMVVFSNTLSVDLTCQESQLILVEGEPTSICYTDNMIFPTLKLTSNNIASSVSLDILVNDEVVLEGVPFIPEEGSENVMLLNISEMYLDATGTPYLPTEGNQKVTIKITESFADGILCERFATGDVSIKIVGHSDAPAGKRPGEHYSYNMCKTEGADAEIDDDKFFFIDLILEGEDKEGLVWVDKDGKIVPEENAFFYADLVQDDSIRVYRDPAGGCPSDTTTIYYRVKEITRTPVVNNYLDCAKEGDPIALSSRIEGADTYKYLLFINGTDTLTTFDPSVPGSKTYKVVASYDEIKSASNNYCEATTELTVKVKDYAKAVNILAKDTAVCSIDSLILLADTEFDTPQTNITITWYPDKDYSRKLAYGKTFSYFLVAKPDTEYPYTVYVTAQSDDYCENISSEAKPVTITLKEQAPSLHLEPKDQTISVGGVPSFTLSPAGEQRYSLYVNDQKVDKTIEEFKPYIDSDYKVVYEGECGSSYDSARVEVLWPTVFTPHKVDGKNDTFVKDMDPQFYTRIYTRYGTKIYESPNGWDGSVGGSMNGKGGVAAPGVYYYIVDLPDGNVKKGTIEVFKY
jgi:hypothetical protein